MRLTEVLRAPLRHWRKSLTVWLLIVLATVGVTLLTSEQYRSEGKLFVGLGRGNTTLDPTATFGQSNFVTLPASREDEINSVVQILTSRLLAEQVVDELGVDYVIDEPLEATPAAKPSKSSPVESETSTTEAATPSEEKVAPEPAAFWPRTQEEWLQRLQPFDPLPRREKAIKALRARLDVGSVKKSMIINLTYEASSPEKAQQVLGHLIEAYLDQHTRLSRTPKSHDFITNQAEESQQRLTKIEDSIRALKSESNVASISDQQRIFESRMGSLQDKLFETDALLKEASAEVAQLETTLKELPNTLVTAQVEGYSNEAADLMRQQLFVLELREKELLSKYKDDVFLVQDVRRQIVEAKAILNDESALRTQVTTSVNQIQESLRHAMLTRKAARESYAAKQMALSGQIAETREEITKLNDRALQISRLEREAAIEESGYRKYAENLEQTRLDHALELERISNVVLAQPPSYEARIVRPRKLINYALGLVLATLASCSLAVFVEYLQLSSRSLESALEEQESFPAARRNPLTASVHSSRPPSQETTEEPSAATLAPVQPR